MAGFATKTDGTASADNGIDVESFHRNPSYREALLDLVQFKSQRGCVLDNSVNVLSNGECGVGTERLQNDVSQTAAEINVRAIYLVNSIGKFGAVVVAGHGHLESLLRQLLERRYIVLLGESVDAGVQQEVGLVLADIIFLVVRLVVAAGLR